MNSGDDLHHPVRPHNGDVQENALTWSPRRLRHACRNQEWILGTAGMAPGFVQTNFVALPRALAFEFIGFCIRNPRPCPVLDVTQPGNYEPCAMASGADLRSDLPAYVIYRNGEVAERVEDIRNYWKNDFVGVLLGCSFTFEKALQEAGLPVRHIDDQRTVPMYRTLVKCEPFGVFSANLVVSMRPMTHEQACRAYMITSGYHLAHGAPISIGNPESLGIERLDKPDFGDPPRLEPGEIPVFWACGVTSQEAIRSAKPDIAIAHAPGHMFVTDLPSVS